VRGQISDLKDPAGNYFADFWVGKMAVSAAQISPNQVVLWQRANM